MDRQLTSEATPARPAAKRGRPPGPLGYTPGSPVAAPLQLLRIADICRLLRISKPTFWRMRRNPEFPRPAELSIGVVAWYASDIQDWIDKRRRPSAQTCLMNLRR